MQPGTPNFKLRPNFHGCRYLFCVVALHAMFPAFAYDVNIADGDTETWIGKNFTNPPQTVTLGKNSTLKFEAQPGSVTFSGTITGDGKVQQSGDDIVTFSGKNTYTGGTTMIGGSMKGTVDSFGSGDIYMNSNTSLIIAQNGNGTLNNTISGGGVLIKDGTGNVTLGSQNDYRGDTYIYSGGLIGTTESFGTGGSMIHFNQSAYGSKYGDPDQSDDTALIIVQDKDGTLNNMIDGNGHLIKDGTGNVTLRNKNDYSGDTYIYSGSLTGTTESFGTKGSTIHFNQSADESQYDDPDQSDDTALIIDQDFDGQWNHDFNNSTQRPNTNTVKFIKRGSGTVTITTDYTFIGPDPSFGGARSLLSSDYPSNIYVEEGVLRAGGLYTLGVRDTVGIYGQDYHIGASGTVDLNGFDHYFNAIDNAGTVTLSPQGQAGTKLTVTKYVGRGGTLVLNTVLGDEKTESDKLVVDEDVSGHTTMVVHDAGGLGAQTTGDGIAVVEVGGKSDEDAFSLAGGHIDAGAYEYHLYKGGLAAGDSRKNDSDAEDSDEKNRDESWYLRSSTIKTLQAGTSGTVAPVTVATAGSLPPVSSGTNVSEPVPTYRRELPLYAGLPAQLRQADLAMLGNLHERIGQTPVAPGCLGWGRFIAGNAEIKQRGLARASSSGAFSGIQLGSDLICRNDWRVGAYGGYLRGDREVRGFAGGSFGKVGDAKIDSYFLAAYGTYTRANGSYLDLVLQAARHDADLRPKGNPGGAQHGNSITLSAQAGLPLALGSSNWTLEPQAQLVNQYLDISDTHISGKTTLRQERDNAFLFRFGADLKNDIKLGRGRFQPYGRVNLYYSPSGADQLTVATPSASQTFSSGAGYTSTELALGATLEVAKKLKVYGQLGHIWSHGGAAKVRSDVQGSIGIRASF